MAKIAAAVDKALERRAREGTPGRAARRLLAAGNGWTVEDVICTSGPADRPFEEQHRFASIAMVVAGSFQYRSHTWSELMTPGSLLLGSAGQPFECAHEHAAGDRCISFHFAPEYLERLIGAASRGDGPAPWRMLRIPPVPELSRLVARASANADSADRNADTADRNADSADYNADSADHGADHADSADSADHGRGVWEEIGVELAGQTARLLADGRPDDLGPASAGAEARVTGIVRAIERGSDGSLSLQELAREAGLGPYHFLRTFQRVAGVTPHQFILRVRLREAALRLLDEPSKVVEIALDCGFGDVSNFNRAFRREFGVSPRAYRGLHALSS